MNKQIINMLKMLKFERYLLSGGIDYAYYRFYNGYMMDYYYDKNIKKNILIINSSHSLNVITIIDDEKEIIDSLFLYFKDQKDIIREIKLKTIGL